MPEEKGSTTTMQGGVLNESFRTRDGPAPNKSGLKKREKEKEWAVRVRHTQRETERRVLISNRMAHQIVRNKMYYCSVTVYDTFPEADVRTNIGKLPKNTKTGFISAYHL